MHPRARTTDPVTSHAAAHDVTKTASIQREQCYEAVMRKPGQTAAEIAQAIGLERHAPSRRLPELREAGRIINGESRICHVTQRMSLTWCAPVLPVTSEWRETLF